jgi:hypothetical protein
MGPGNISQKETSKHTDIDRATSLWKKIKNEKTTEEVN